MCLLCFYLAEYLEFNYTAQRPCIVSAIAIVLTSFNVAARRDPTQGGFTLHLLRLPSAAGAIPPCDSLLAFWPVITSHLLLSDRKQAQLDFLKPQDPSANLSVLHHFPLCSVCTSPLERDRCTGDPFCVRPPYRPGSPIASKFLVSRQSCSIPCS